MIPIFKDYLEKKKKFLSENKKNIQHFQTNAFLLLNPFQNK